MAGSGIQQKLRTKPAIRWYVKLIVGFLILAWLGRLASSLSCGGEQDSERAKSQVSVYCAALRANAALERAGVVMPASYDGSQAECEQDQRITNFMSLIPKSEEDWMDRLLFWKAWTLVYQRCSGDPDRMIPDEPVYESESGRLERIEGECRAEANLRTGDLVLAAWADEAFPGWLLPEGGPTVGRVWMIKGKPYNDPYGVDYKNDPADRFGDGR